MDFRKVYGLAQKSRLLGEEYEAFGADLGVDLSKRVFYDWVVVEYARAQIPEPWVAYSDDGGRTFYHGQPPREVRKAAPTAARPLAHWATAGETRRAKRILRMYDTSELAPANVDAGE